MPRSNQHFLKSPAVFAKVVYLPGNAGGILLPGFLTDVLGLMMLLPFTRPVVRRLLAFVLARSAARGGSAGPVVISGVTVDSAPTAPVVIEGELEERA